MTTNRTIHAAAHRLISRASLAIAKALAIVAVSLALVAGPIRTAAALDYINKEAWDEMMRRAREIDEILLIVAPEKAEQAMMAWAAKQVRNVGPLPTDDEAEKARKIKRRIEAVMHEIREARVKRSDACADCGSLLSSGGVCPKCSPGGAHGGHGKGHH